MDKLKIAVSTDPPKDIIELNSYLKQVEKYADFIHFDIMDGKFVERTTYKSKDVKWTKKEIICLIVGLLLMLIGAFIESNTILS